MPRIACIECQKSSPSVRLRKFGTYACDPCTTKIQQYFKDNGLDGKSGWDLIDAVHLLQMKTGAKQ